LVGEPPQESSAEHDDRAHSNHETLAKPVHPSSAERDGRSAAGRPPARPLQRLVSRPTHAARLSSGENDLPISESRDQFEFAAQRRHVPTQCGNEAVFEITPSLEAGHIRLVHGRVRCNLDLRLPDGFADSTNRQMNTPLRT
jgi:hypothetical protein